MAKWRPDFVDIFKNGIHTAANGDKEVVPLSIKKNMKVYTIRETDGFFSAIKYEA